MMPFESFLGTAHWLDFAGELAFAAGWLGFAGWLTFAGWTGFAGSVCFTGLGFAGSVCFTGLGFAGSACFAGLFVYAIARLSAGPRGGIYEESEDIYFYGGTVFRGRLCRKQRS